MTNEYIHISLNVFIQANTGQENNVWWKMILCELSPKIRSNDGYIKWD